MSGPPFRSFVRAILAALLLASCSATTPPGSTGDPSLLHGSQRPSASGGDTGSSSSPTRGGTLGPGGTTPAPGTTPTRAAPTEAVYADDAGVGAMARAYLQASPARRLVVEVDYVAGRAPSQEALEHFAGILRREADKPDGVRVLRGNQIAQTRSRYSFADIEALERAHRDQRSAGSKATMYVLYLDGELAEEPSALGVAYRASSAALFIDQIRGAATALVQPVAIERAVLVHEAGHLLALVNIGYKSRYDHEDPDHPHHSRFKDSVMFWAIEDISVASILTGGPPDDFDRYDRDDLDQLRRS